MARSRHPHPEHVTPRAPAEKGPEPPKGIGPGWTIAITVWVLLFGVLIVYELWGFFGGLFRR